MATLVGQKLGKYEIVDSIGEGGMASVYKGYDASIDRYVAVKVLVADSNLESNRAKMLIERFQLEAKTIARLQHPHILAVHDYGVQENILYLIMPYVEGGTLKDRIVEGESLSLGEASRILNQLASALDYAHRQGIVHRDIKPSNILLDQEGNVLLADFGLVKMMSSNSNLTETGAVVGTPSYISPEYGSGMEVTSSSDIYSLGVTIFEAVIGRPPFGDTTTHSPMQIAMLHIMEPVPIVSKLADHVPPMLDDVFAKVLAKEPGDRYATATAFAEGFAEAIRDHSSDVVAANFTISETKTAAPVKTVVPAERPDDKISSTTITIQWNNRAGLMTIAAAVVIVIAIVGAVLLSRPGEPSGDDNGSVKPVVAGANVSEPQFGQATFLTTGGLGDTLSLQVKNLRSAPASSRYYVWLVNTGSGTALNVGMLPLDALGNGTLNYNHPQGVFLPAVFNAILITAEDPDTIAETPSDQIFYMGSIPEEVTQALYNILLSSPKGIDERGLLSSAIAEAYIAREQTTVENQSITTSRALTLAEYTLNTLNGTNEDYNGDGQGSNPGFGFGLPVLLDDIDHELDVITGASAGSASIETNAEFIRVCVANTRERVNRVVDLQGKVIAASDAAAVQDEIGDVMSTLDVLLAGVDQNTNGRIEGFVGECGLDQIAELTLLIGTMEIQEADFSGGQAVAYNTPYAFTPGLDMCIDTELVYGIEKTVHDHMPEGSESSGMDM